MSKISLKKGAKGKNLEYIQKNIKEWNNEIGSHNFPFHLDMPNFFIIPSSVFEKYLNSKQNLFISGEKDGETSLERLLLPYSKRYKKSIGGQQHEYKFIARSSAVYSEDGEDLTGAGIYDSIVVRKNNEFNEDVCELDFNLYGLKSNYEKGNFKYSQAFTIAVYSVYRSIYSDKAIQYREKNKVKEEKMCVIIQDYLDFGSDGSFINHYISRDGKGIGYFNSIIKGQPDKCKIVKNGIAYILNRENLLKDLDLIMNYDGFLDFDNNKNINYSIYERQGNKKIFLTPLDSMNFNSDSAYFMALYFLLLERRYGKFLQIEFVVDFGYLENGHFGNSRSPFSLNDYNEEVLLKNQGMNKLNLVQVRPLPKNYEEVKSIKFPKKEPLFVGEGIGVGRIKLKNLSKGNNLRGGDYSNKKGILVCDESEGYTNLNGKNELPKTGGVIVVYPSDFHHGHLETLISERDDLIGVFNGSGRIEHSWSSDDKTRSEIMQEKTKYYDNIFKQLKEADKIEIVSDGLDARVYIN